jgi:hypothetical protein
MNTYMVKAGVPQFNYESFKSLYDTVPQLKNLVKFDPEGITVNDDAMDQVSSPTADGNDNVVGDMAKRATDLKGL